MLMQPVCADTERELVLVLLLLLLLGGTRCCTLQ